MQVIFLIAPSILSATYARTRPRSVDSCVDAGAVLFHFDEWTINLCLPQSDGLSDDVGKAIRGTYASSAQLDCCI